jgi:hypothetical protein
MRHSKSASSEVKAHKTGVFEGRNFSRSFSTVASKFGGKTSKSLQAIEKQKRREALYSCGFRDVLQKRANPRKTPFLNYKSEALPTELCWPESRRDDLHAAHRSARMKMTLLPRNVTK